jgi:membrane fusion protein (multidrug efflux system)
VRCTIPAAPTVRPPRGSLSVRPSAPFVAARFRFPRPAVRVLTSAALGLLGLGLVACQRGAGGPPVVEGSANSGLRDREATRVVTVPLEAREMRRLLETTCVIESELEIDVTPRLPGVVTEVLVEENDLVPAGALLARLDDREQVLALRDAEIALAEAHQAVSTAEVAVAEAESRIATAERALSQAERDYQRDLALRTGGENPFGSVSEKAVEASLLARDQAEQELTQARLALERSTTESAAAATGVTRAEVAKDRAALTLEYMRIEAPIAGHVATRAVRVGATVSGSEPAFRLTNTEQLRTVFYRPQRELALFRLGSEGPELELTARTEAVPGATFAGHIQRTSPTIDATSGSFRVTATLDRRPREEGLEGVLLPGMLVRIQIVTDRRIDALTAPKRAVRREGEQAYVHVVREGLAQRVDVIEGYADDEYVELLPADAEDQLRAGERVVVVGGRDLEDGEAVRDAQAEAAEAQSVAQPDAELRATEPAEADAPSSGDGTDRG